MPSVIVCNGKQEGLFLPLGKKVSVIGRDEALPLQVEDDKVSRRHVQIRFEPSDSRYRAVDMKSTNGTLFNGRAVTTEMVLSEGDEIQIGDTKMIFTMEDPKDRPNALAVLKKVGERRRSTLMKQ
jgi:pSer/pThr/pTyr-binding forkhead associated (FHA) protein